MAFFQVVVLDLDGTIASRGNLSAKALDAVDQVRRDGVTVILATGQIATELDAEFPQSSLVRSFFGTLSIVFRFIGLLAPTEVRLSTEQAFDDFEVTVVGHLNSSICRSSQAA